MEGWKEKEGPEADELKALADAEDEAREEEMENFEAKYNFRFEEANAATITTYARQVEDSIRRKDNTRKEARERAMDRKKEEKTRK
eukprot:CAMPEP_0116874886 /NCGR_PEP_ID=MMETSP0463-20121206/6488_1 /TAXON_ID=181622 /ORGANISM="Strombidinopsis sp, Strain SopsisLIS2011" /LENGTH=85 /DNA_ID=CAMNT_0004519259 /DNA_START=782 /DNA_END=1039 /DNA_ORIENTATION=+